MPTGAPWIVPQFKPFLSRNEEEAVASCVRSGWITEGPLCAEFVERVKALAGVRYGVLAPNGTLALYLALKACGIDERFDVIVPDLTFVATATAVVMAGAQPIFCDVNEYGQLSWEKAKTVPVRHRLFTLLPVHLYGMASNEYPTATSFGTFGEVCIEDACQALGVLSNGRPCGSLGTASAFSFFADKTITTGEGGFVGTNDEAVYEKLRYLRNQGRIDRGSFVHPKIGQNFRMTDLQAALGLAQLDRFDEIVARKQEIHAAYREVFSTVAGIRTLEAPPGSSHIPFRTVVFFDRPAEEAAAFLRAKGVEPRSAFYPLHKQPCFEHLAGDSRYADALFANANYFYDHALCLPTWPGMTKVDVNTVASAVVDFARGETTQ